VASPNLGPTAWSEGAGTYSILLRATRDGVTYVSNQVFINVT